MVIRAPQHQIIVGKERHHEASDWCENRFGKRWSAIDNREGRWCCFWTGFRNENAGMYAFHFTEKRDAVEFALRWS